MSDGSVVEQSVSNSNVLGLNPGCSESKSPVSVAILMHLLLAILNQGPWLS